MIDEKALAKALEDLAVKIQEPYRFGVTFEGRKADRDDILIEVYRTISRTLYSLGSDLGKLP